MFSEPIAGFFGEYRWLSNFWMSPVVCGEFTFPSAEHAYQAAKSDDPNTWRRFTKIETPAYAKKAGYLVRLRPNWDELKLVAMEEILAAKFENAWLRQNLLDTGERELIEANNWGDTFWGVCQGHGHNHLGRLLMELRTKLNQET